MQIWFGLAVIVVGVVAVSFIMFRIGMHLGARADSRQPDFLHIAGSLRFWLFMLLGIAVAAGGACLIAGVF